MSINPQSEASKSSTKPADNTPARKFLFEHSFSDELAMAEREQQKLQLTQEQINAVKQDAYNAGFTAGQAAVNEDRLHHLQNLMAQIEQKLSVAIHNATTEMGRHAVMMQELALTIARKILPDYTARHGLDEIRAIVAATIAEMAREPRLVVRIAESSFDDVSTQIKTITEQQAYTGKVVILADNALGPADCRIEWADGGIERDESGSWKEIDAIIARGKSLAATGAPSNTST